MRIGGGIWKGRVISTFGGGYRPTAGIVKKSLFDILAVELEGSRFLDLFAGSGAVGLEALSRGADFVCFVENSPSRANVLRKNIERLNGEQGGTEVLAMDYAYALQALMKRREIFDIIYVDPPYSGVVLSRILGDIAASRILDSDGLIVYESARKDIRKILETMPEELYPLRERDLGGTALIFIRWRGRRDPAQEVRED